MLPKLARLFNRRGHKLEMRGPPAAATADNVSCTQTLLSGAAPLACGQECPRYAYGLRRCNFNVLNPYTLVRGCAACMRTGVSALRIGAAPSDVALSRHKRQSSVGSPTRFWCSEFGIRSSAFFRTSNFGFRTSDFGFRTSDFEPLTAHACFSRISQSCPKAHTSFLLAQRRMRKNSRQSDGKSCLRSSRSSYRSRPLNLMLTTNWRA
jgi:hypothetical protein